MPFPRAYPEPPFPVPIASNFLVTARDWLAWFRDVSVGLNRREQAMVYDATLFSGVAGSWAPSPGQVSYWQYLPYGRRARYRGAFLAVDVTGAPTELRVALPDGLSFGAFDTDGRLVYEDDGGARTIGVATAKAGQPYVSLETIDRAAWTATVAGTSIWFDVDAELM